jgi:fucose 4-O-acetylase-like acetyltransferase
MKARNVNWDMARGIAIWLVVWGHLVIGDSLIKEFIYLIHMPLFFVISGYFIFFSLKKYNMKENLAKRTRALLLPWFTWSAVAWIMACIKNIILTGKVDYLFLKEKFIEVYITSMSLRFYGDYGF